MPTTFTKYRIWRSRRNGSIKIEHWRRAAKAGSFARKRKSFQARLAADKGNRRLEICSGPCSVLAGIYGSYRVIAAAACKIMSPTNRHIGAVSAHLQWYCEAHMLDIALTCVSIIRRCPRLSGALYEAELRKRNKRNIGNAHYSAFEPKCYQMTRGISKPCIATEAKLHLPPPAAIISYEASTTRNI